MNNFNSPRPKFTFDYQDLESKLNRKQAFLLADVKDRIKKVAFDVVKFNDDDNFEHLWQIQGEGESQFIVALYDTEEKQTKTASVSPWSAISDAGYVQVFFRNSPITKIALQPLGIPVEDAHLVCNSLPKKLATDHDFLQKFLNNLNAQERSVLESELPELGK